MTTVGHEYPGMGIRAANALTRAHIGRDKLEKLTVADVLRVRGMGVFSAIDAVQWLKDRGVVLAHGWKRETWIRELSSSDLHRPVSRQTINIVCRACGLPEAPREVPPPPMIQCPLCKGRGKVVPQ